MGLTDYNARFDLRLCRPVDEKQGKEKLTVSTVSDEKLINIIGLLMSTYKKYVEGQIELEPLEHTVLEEELNKPEYGGLGD